MDNDFKICPCQRGLCAKGCGRQDKQLNTYDYLAGIPGNSECSDLVEVQFKHTRKGYYRNDNHLPLEKGDMVAVEATPGHDIGVVTLTGQLVPLQMKKANLKPGTEIKRVYRKARPADLEKFEEAKALEQSTMIRSRKIAKDLELNMKIGDVEYQGDGNKAIFYYIADARVDFRQLIKVLAEAFHVRIEMKQIGARQEAGRIGGIGPCGRELCCATWMKNFNSVSTMAARFQDISPNPQKLAGQCAKLKCCLNYEVDTYVEASRKLPQRDVPLETADSTYYIFKVDILANMITYSTDKRLAANLVSIPATRANEIIQMNRQGEKPLTLEESAPVEPARPVDLVEQEDLHRFDKSKRKKNNKNKRGQNPNGEARRDKQSKGQQPRDGQPRDKQPRESQAPRDGQPRDKQPRENQAPRDGQPRDKQPRENQAPRDGQPRDKQPRENQAPRDGQPRDKQPRENQAPRDGQPRDKQPRENQAPRDGQPRDKQPRENQPPRDGQPRDKQPRENQAPRNGQSRDKQPRENQHSREGQPRENVDKNKENGNNDRRTPANGPRGNRNANPQQNDNKTAEPEA